MRYEVYACIGDDAPAVGRRTFNHIGFVLTLPITSCQKVTALLVCIVV